MKDPENYGVAEFDSKGNIIKLVEKPKKPKSNYAITGLYFYDNTVVERARQLEVSDRDEIEITDLNNSYIRGANTNLAHFELCTSSYF